MANVELSSAALEMSQVQAAARMLGLDPVALEIRRAEDIAPAFESLKDRADALYVGPNLRMDIPWGGGNVNRASVFAKELVALQPDVILAQGTPLTAALQRETRTIPIVFATVLAKRRAETYDCLETC
jgi:ABC-type uncharacterized transport system substrate-binding protein